MTSAENESDRNPEDGNLDQESVGVDGAAEQQPKLSLDVSVESPSACQRHVTVTISRDDVDRYFQQQFDELMPKAEVPGFRPGRAPRKLVESKFRSQVKDQVKGSLLLDSMTQVNEEQDFSAISEPDFDFESIELPDEGALTFEFDIEVRPEFEMPQWKGVSLERPVRDFTDEDVNRQLGKILARYADLVPYEGAAELGDYVVVRLVARHSGEEVSQSDELTLCVRPQLSFPDALLTDFDKLMVGAKAGDKKTATVMVSGEAEVEALRDQEVEVEFEVLDIKRQEIPEFTPEILSELGDFDDEQALRDAVKSELERQLSFRQSRVIRDQISSTLTESADWELPPDLLRRQSHRELERAVLEMRSSGFSESEIQAYENDLKQNTLQRTEKSLKEHFILERIAEEQDIEDLPEDYDKEIMLIALQQNDSPRRVRARLEKRGQMDVLRNQIIERKVLDIIQGEATIKDVPYEMEIDKIEAVDHCVAGVDKSAVIPEAKYEGGDAQSLKSSVARS